MNEKINVEELTQKAKKSCCNESFIILMKKPYCRVGVGALVDKMGNSSYFMEVNNNLCPGTNGMKIGILEKIIRLSQLLQDRGYELTCLDGYISCVKNIDGPNLNSEYDEILKIIYALNIE